MNLVYTNIVCNNLNLKKGKGKGKGKGQTQYPAQDKTKFEECDRKYQRKMRIIL